MIRADIVKQMIIICKWMQVTVDWMRSLDPLALEVHAVDEDSTNFATARKHVDYKPPHRPASSLTV